MSEVLEYELGLGEFCEVLEASVADRNRLVSLLHAIVQPPLLLRDAGVEWDPVIHYHYGVICGWRKITAISIMYPKLKVVIRLSDVGLREAEAKMKSKKR